MGTRELAVLQQRWCLGFHGAISTTCLEKASVSQRCYNLSALTINSRRLKNYSGWAKGTMHVLGNSSPCFPSSVKTIIMSLCSSLPHVGAKPLMCRGLGSPSQLGAVLSLPVLLLTLLATGLILCLMPSLEKRKTLWRKRKTSHIRLRDDLESVQVRVKACFPCRFSGG